MGFYAVYETITIGGARVYYYGALDGWEGRGERAFFFGGGGHYWAMTMSIITLPSSSTLMMEDGEEEGGRFICV